MAGYMADIGESQRDATQDPGSAERQLREPGDHPVEAPAVCVVTRFQVRHPLQLLASYLDYRCVLKQARASNTPGLLRSAFLVENLTTFYNLSIWADVYAIPQFGSGVSAHVRAGNNVLGRLVFDPERGPELWSTKWRLASVSHNLNWGDLDLRGLILEAGKVLE